MCCGEGFVGISAMPRAPRSIGELTAYPCVGSDYAMRRPLDARFSQCTLGPTAISRRAPQHNASSALGRAPDRDPRSFSNRDRGDVSPPVTDRRGATASD